MSAEQAHARLREALEGAGHELPEGVSLLELAVRAARIVREVGAAQRAQAFRAAHRALPSGDATDPWRVGAWLIRWNGDMERRWHGGIGPSLTSGRWSRHLIVDRVLEGGVERLSLHMVSVYVRREAGAWYAAGLRSPTAFLIPDTDPAGRLAALDRFRNEHRRMFEPPEGILNTRDVLV